MSDGRERKGVARLMEDRITVQTWPSTIEPARFDLSVQQGASVAVKFEWLDVAGSPRDLTGYSADMHIRKHPGDADPLIDLGASLTVAAAGTITLSVAAATTAAWSFTRAVYDLTMTDGSGAVTRIVEGWVDLGRAVTV